jgi:purine-cytosine permease-like protein
LNELLLFAKAMAWLLFAIIALVVLMVIFFGIEAVNGFLRILTAAFVGLVEDE